MSFTIDGLTNANTFYSQHYLDDILEKDLKSLFERWKAQGNQSPAARLKAAGGANGYFRNRERFLAAKSPESRAQHLQGTGRAHSGSAGLRRAPAEPPAGRQRA